MISWDSKLALLTPAELSMLPYGTVIYSIMGNCKSVGVDVIDMDTRGGYTAWGVYNPMSHPLRDLFIQFAMEQ